MHQSFRNRTAIHFALIALFAAAAMMPSFLFGVTSGNDSPQHYQFAATFYTSVASGDHYPGLRAAANNGYSDVGVRIYPPAAYYALSGLYFIVNDWYAASLAMFYLVFLLGGAGIYLWAREEFSPSTALLAAALFTFAPYHLNQIYNNFLLTDFAATSVMPFGFLFISRTCRRGGVADVCGLGAAYGLLILTNLPQAVIGSLAFAAYALFLLERRNFVSSLLKLAVASVLGAALSCFYWLRMVTELEWVRHGSSEFFSGIWSYRSNFLLTPQHILDFWDDVLVLWLADVMLVSMVLICVPSIVYLIKNRLSEQKFVFAAAAMFMIAIFMTTPASGFIWDNIVYLQMVQFPWRWMSIVTAFGAVLGSFGIAKAARPSNADQKPILKFAVAAAFLCFAFTTAFVVKGAVYHPRDEFNVQTADAAGRISCQCFWPIWAKQAAIAQKEKVTVQDREVEIAQWSDESRSFEIGPGPSENARVATYWYPHWKAEVNGSPVDLRADENGAILIPLPETRSFVKLYFKEPYFVAAGNYLSLFSWLGLLLISLPYLRRRVIALYRCSL